MRVSLNILKGNLPSGMTLNKLIRCTHTAVLAGALSAIPAYAQVPGAGPKKLVKEVQIISVGGAKIDSSRIIANMATREGTTFEEEAVDRDIKNLYTTGLVESVDISTVDVGGGVKVVVKVTGRGAIGEVAFVGNSVIDSEKLRKSVEVKVNEPVDEAKLFAGATKIRESYAKKGFADVGVEYKIESLPTAGFVRVVYSIAEGQRGIINDIRFEGLTAVKESTLRSKLQLKEKRPWHLWGKSGKLNNDGLQEDIRTVERAVQDEGYVYAKVVQVRREPVKDDRVDLVFVLDEGKQYNVSEVAIEGNTVFTHDELTPALTLETGAAYSATDISNDEKMLGEYYGSRGYADARIDTSVVPAGPSSVKILYRIAEGEKSYINKINIEGNTKTKDNVIRRELAFAPGEEFNTVRIEKSRSRLSNMGYFSQVDFRNNPTGTPGYKDIDISVTEQSTGSINIGAGFSSIDSLVGFFSLTQTNFDITNWPNFTGGGQRFNLDVRYGDKRRDFSLSVVEPGSSASASRSVVKSSTATSTTSATSMISRTTVLRSTSANRWVSTPTLKSPTRFRTSRSTTSTKKLPRRSRMKKGSTSRARSTFPWSMTPVTRCTSPAKVTRSPVVPLYPVTSSVEMSACMASAWKLRSTSASRWT